MLRSCAREHEAVPNERHWEEQVKAVEPWSHGGWAVSERSRHIWYRAYGLGSMLKCRVTRTCSIAAPGTASGAHLNLTMHFIATACPHAWRCACCTSALHQLQRQQVLRHRRTKNDTAGRCAQSRITRQQWLHACETGTERDWHECSFLLISVTPTCPYACPCACIATHPPRHLAGRHTHRMLSSREAPASVCRSERASPCRLHVMLTPAL